MEMSGPLSSKTKKPGFGRRGLAEPVQPGHKPTSMERLKKIGSRWWNNMVSHKRKGPKGARVGRLRS
jgi:hypothetical protein